MPKEISPSLIISEINKNFDFYSFFRHLIEGDCDLSHLSDFILNLSLDNFEIKDEEANSLFLIENQESKKEIFDSFVKKRSDYLDIFESFVNRIFTVRTQNIAIDKGIVLSNPQFILVSSLDSLSITSQFIMLVDSIKKMNQSPILHLILDFNSLSDELDYKLRCIANLKEFDHYIESNKSKVGKVHIWVIDDINEKEYSIGDKSNKLLTISIFIYYLLNDYNRLKKSIFPWGNEQGKVCFLSTFGLSTVKYPIGELKQFLINYGRYQRLEGLWKSLNKKFLRLTLKEELESFYRINDFNSISDRIITENGINIYKPFNLNVEKYSSDEADQSISKRLRFIDSPNALPLNITSDFYFDYETLLKDYKSSYLSDFFNKLEFTRKNEGKNLTTLFENHIIENLDDDKKGVVFSMLFNYITVNDEALVEEYLDEGRFGEFKTLNLVESNIRKKLLGEELSILEKIRQENSDNVLNKEQNIEKYKEEQTHEEIDLRILKNNDDDLKNPKIPELEESLKLNKQAIEKLSLEIDEHNKNIKIYTGKIVKLFKEFDNDAYKEQLRRKLNPQIDDKLKDLKESIKNIDKSLIGTYNRKNRLLKERLSFIKKRLVFIPVLILVVLLVPQLILFYSTDYFNMNELIVGVIIEGIILIIYYLKTLFDLNKLVKDLKENIDYAKNLINNKARSFQKITELTNTFYYKDFLFDVNLISLSILRKLRSNIRDNADSIKQFIEVINKTYKDYKSNVENFTFRSNDFEFVLVNNNDLIELYGSEIGRDFSKNAGKVSEYYKIYSENESLDGVFKVSDEEVNKLYNSKIVSKSVKGLLFNEYDDINDKVNADIIIEKVINSSKPLLKTSASLFSHDVPYSQDILIGKQYDSVRQIMNSYNLLTPDYIIEENNDKVIGNLIIKSNFPPIYVDKIEGWVSFAMNSLNNTDYEKWYINSNYSKHNLVLNVSTDSANEFGEDIILALCEEVIYWDKDEKSFLDKESGKFGKNMDELVKTWNTERALDLKSELRKVAKRVANYSDTELSSMLTKLESVVLYLKIEKHYLSYFENFYFAYGGKEDNWDNLLIKKSKV